MKLHNKLLIAIGFATALALGAAPYATSTPLPSVVPQETFSATSLDEYAQMDRDAQRDLILDTKEEVISQIREGDPQRALCVADIGIDQFNDIKGILNKAAEKNIPRSAQEVVERVITHRICPENSVAMR